MTKQDIINWIDAAGKLNLYNAAKDVNQSEVDRLVGIYLDFLSGATHTTSALPMVSNMFRTKNPEKSCVSGLTFHLEKIVINDWIAHYTQHEIEKMLDLLSHGWYITVRSIQISGGITLTPQEIAQRWNDAHAEAEAVYFPETEI